jgi:hypothetical protein
MIDIETGERLIMKQCRKCSNAQFCLFHSKAFKDASLIDKIRLLIKVYRPIPIHYSGRYGFKYLKVYCFNTNLIWVIAFGLYRFEIHIEYRKKY